MDEETIAYLTRLSRIECTGSVKAKLLKNLEAVLEYISLLDEVDTTGVPPCNHVLSGMHSVVRQDEPCEPMPRALFLANAPEHIGGMIKVPPILKT